jgi:hypothetical protein
MRQQPALTTREMMRLKIDKKLLWRGKFVMPAFVACYAFLTGNETVFPTALVLTLLGIALTVDSMAQETDRGGRNPLGTAGRSALIVFSVLIAFSSIVASLFLADFVINGTIARFDGESARNVITSLHGFAGMTGLFLLICIGSIGRVWWLQPGTRMAGDAGFQKCPDRSE